MRTRADLTRELLELLDRAEDLSEQLVTTETDSIAPPLDEMVRTQEEARALLRLFILDNRSNTAFAVRALINAHNALLDRCKHMTDGPKDSPPCDCEVGKTITGKRLEHALACASRRTYATAVIAARFEWEKARELTTALAALVDGVGAEVAIHPGIHDRTGVAWQHGRDILDRYEEGGAFPGDDGMPF